MPVREPAAAPDVQCRLLAGGARTLPDLLVIPIVYDITVPIDDDCAVFPVDGSAAATAFGRSSVAALAIPSDGFATLEIERGYLGIEKLPVIIKRLRELSPFAND